MTTSEKTTDWREVLSALDIDVEPSSPPVTDGLESERTQDDRRWFQTLTRFTRRGFLRVLLTPGDDSIGIHVQYAVPGADASYARKLKHHLSDLSGVSWTSDTTQSPWVLYGADIGAAKTKAIVEVFLRVADHISAAEDGARASVLAIEFGSDSEQESEASDAGEKKDSSSNPFENIGSETPSESDEDDNLGGSRSDAPRLEAFGVSVRDGVIHANVDFEKIPPQSVQPALLEAFSQALSVRFDIVLLSRGFADSKSSKTPASASIELMMRANIEADTGEIAHDLGRYFERLKKFNDLGLSLLEVLGSGGADRGKTTPHPGSKTEDDRRSRKQVLDENGRRSSARPVSSSTEKPSPTNESTSSNEVVLSFGGGALDVEDITTDALRPGHYTDPRIRRDDATTPLVDVVLRHPGFSDKSMRQVLSILLDVTYYEATNLSERAPCLIAWGISQERAAEFKNVIEKAGGRVTLVEPDSLS